MRIAARLAVQRTAGDARESERSKVVVETTMRALGYHGIDVIVRNISANGFMVETDGHFPPDTHIRLRLPGLGAVLGRVVWTESGQVGGAFLNPLEEGRLKRIVGFSRPD